MTEQPPVQPNQPPNQPTRQPGQGDPATQPMSAATSPAGPTPPAEPKKNPWRQAASTNRGRWALALGAGVLGALMLLGIGLAGLAVLGLHDRVSFMGDRGDRRDGFSRGQDRLGRGPDARDRNQQRLPGGPGSGLGGLLNGTALHGEVTASANRSVQSLVFQRGEVTAVSGTSITLKSSDGFAGTYGLTADTRSLGATAVKGGQAFVLARASDKLAIRVIATRARVGVAPTS